jgi:hypothetical protein
MTGRSPGSRRSAIGAALVASLAACTPAVAGAQAWPDEPRASVSGLVGIGRANDATFRELYGPVVPIGAQVDVRLGGAGVEVFAGVRYVGRTGEASDAGLPAAQSLTFRMTSVRVGAGWIVPGERWRFVVAGGASYDHYRESWEGLGEDARDATFGIVAQATVSRRLSRRAAVLVRGEYSSIGTDAADPALGRVNLGSFDLVAGMSFGF